MKTLKAFNNSISEIQLEADVIRNQAKLDVKYKITGANDLIKLPESFKEDTRGLLRSDGLWNDTCFELFLRPVGKSSYYEFNFSLNKAWNEYYFSSYRQPQPPQKSDDFVLITLSWNGQFLEAQLTGLNPDKQYDLSLTAVLKEKTGAIHYLALHHAGKEADFHHVDSFILRV